MKTSIIILTFNKLNYTKLCIESIRKYTQPGSYEMIVIDNFSSDETRAWLSAQSDLKIILNDSNLGFPKGCNQGIEIASGDYILLLNNDTVVTENWLINLLACINSDKSIGAVSCVTNNCSYAQEIPVEYKSLEEMQQFARGHNQTNPSLWEERLKLVGFCFLTKKSVVEKIGLLDECFTPGNYEDDDYSVRIRKAGYRLILCKDTFIHHFGSISFKEDGGFFQGLLGTNAKKFENKWGFDPVESQHIHFELTNLIDHGINDSFNILHVGCACGGTLLDIKNKYKMSRLYGADFNPHSASIASLIAEVRVMGNEKELPQYPHDFFDYIITTVLTEVGSPWELLRGIKQYLKPTGKILLSIPNLMHHSVVSGLLEGYWGYNDFGVLNKKNIRFFTLREINKLLTEEGYYRIKPYSWMLPGDSKNTHLEKQLDGIMPKNVIKQMHVYRYLIKAQKNHLPELLKIVIETKEMNSNVYEKFNNYTDEEVIQAVLFSRNLNKVELLNTLGVLFFENAVYERVIPYFENALILDEKNHEALFNISYFLCFIGEDGSAKGFMQRLHSINPEEYEILIRSIDDLKIR